MIQDEFCANITSQNGEDGIIAHLLDRLVIRRGFFVEFGAWDGRYLSNTWNLWAKRGWSGVLIEANRRRYKALRRNVAGYPVRALRARVGWSQADCLETLVSLPRDFELLSIDIDGDDYWVWKATQSDPKIVVVEFNASFPPETVFVQEKGAFIGSSLASFVNLGIEKGYRLVAVTRTNLVFLRSDLVDFQPPNPEDMYDRKWTPLVFSDLAGVHHLVRPAQWGYLAFRSHVVRQVSRKGRILNSLRFVRYWVYGLGHKSTLSVRANRSGSSSDDTSQFGTA